MWCVSFSFDFLPVKALVVGFHQLCVNAAFGHQLSMAALLPHHPIAEDNDVVGLLHNTHVPGYQQDGAVDLFEQSLAHLWETPAVEYWKRQ